MIGSRQFFSRWVGVALAVVVSTTMAQSAAPPDERGFVELTYSLDQLLDAETAASVSEVLAPTQTINWRAYVPQGEQTPEPPGLLVFVSPTDKVWLPRGWQSVLDENNLIFLGAEQSGNRQFTPKRMLLAVLGTVVAGRHYEVDESRTYVAGFSGGGKVASIVAIDFANVFRGALYIGGVEAWRSHPPAEFSHVKNNRYVFLAGENDFNLDLTKEIYRFYQDAGVRNIKLMEVPRLAHRMPGPADFRKALAYLDKRP